MLIFIFIYILILNIIQIGTDLFGSLNSINRPRQIASSDHQIQTVLHKLNNVQKMHSIVKYWTRHLVYANGLVDLNFFLHFKVSFLGEGVKKCFRARSSFYLYNNILNSKLKLIPFHVIHKSLRPISTANKLKKQSVKKQTISAIQEKFFPEVHI